LIEAQERERQRIAAELHDSLGQNLQVIKNRALLDVAQDNVKTAQSQFRELNELAATAIEEVRHIAHDLRPPNLARLGLTSTLEEMLEEMAEATGIDVSVTIDPLDGLFTPAAELNVSASCRKPSTTS
jgi:signal transduction histidine kinase